MEPSGRSYNIQEQKVEYKLVECVDLTISAEAAHFLHEFLSIVGGSPTRSRRRYAAHIIKALEQAGISTDYDAMKFTCMRDVTIHDRSDGNRHLAIYMNNEE